MKKISEVPNAPESTQAPGDFVLRVRDAERRPAQTMTVTVVAAQRGEDTTMGDLADSIKKLAALTPRLNEVTNGANLAFRAAEDAVGSLGVGITAFVDVADVHSSSRTRGSGERKYVENVIESIDLVYERISGKFRIGFQLCTTVAPADDPYNSVDEFDDPIAWDQASREWKLMGVTVLPSLIQNIIEKAQELMLKAEDATIAVDEILGDLPSISNPK
jgi:hypothetical protein